MKIAIVAPLYVRVPPRWYGGTERVVSWITEGLVRRGHQVTLFASGDSETKAEMVSACKKALWRSEGILVPEIYHAIELGMVMDRAEEFDIIHSHLDSWLYPFRRHCPTPIVTTLHGRTDLQELQDLYNYYDKPYLISVSKAQERCLPDANWVATVWHGMPDENCGYNPNQGEYLAFLGRLSPEKRADIAIHVARRTGLPLKIAARIPEHKPHYLWYKEHVEPLMASTPNVEYVGEVGDKEKYELLRNARALLAPVDWPEPFGLMFIEAWAVGTPVIARPYGSVPELVIDGKVGYVADTLDDMIRAVGKIDRIDRATCRNYFSDNFTVEKMIDRYEAVYQKILNMKSKS